MLKFIGNKMAKKGVFHAEYALAAAGRRPNVDNIGLENLNIEKMHVACLLLIR